MTRYSRWPLALSPRTPGEATPRCSVRSASREQPVQVPARLDRVAIETEAEQPEAQAVTVLDAEIVARRAVLAPPGADDALGPLGRHHVVQRAAPAEAQRRAVRHRGQGLD